MAKNVSIQLKNQTRLNCIVSNTKKLTCIIHGSLLDWREAILNTQSKSIDSQVCKILNQFQLYFESIGLKLWDSYRKQSNLNETFNLIEMR